MTPLNKSELKLALEDLFTCDFIDLEYIQKGIASDNYIINGLSKKYIARIDYRRPLKSLIEDVHTIECLFSNNINTFSSPYIVLSIKGVSVFIRPYIPGKILSDIQENVDYFRLGLEIGKLHIIPVNPQRKSFYHFLFDDKMFDYQKLKNFDFRPLIDVIEDKEIFNIAEKARSHVLSNGILFKKYSFPYCFCHGDLKFDNIIINENSIFIIDWEKSHWGIRCFDLCLSIFHLIINFKSKSILEDFQNFIKGYLCKLQLIKEEIENLFKILDTVAYSWFIVDSMFFCEALYKVDSLLKEKRIRYFIDVCIPKIKFYEAVNYEFKSKNELFLTNLKT